jgi:hypothetical protein
MEKSVVRVDLTFLQNEGSVSIEQVSFLTRSDLLNQDSSSGILLFFFAYPYSGFFDVSVAR